MDGLERAEQFVHGSEFDFEAWNHAQDAGRPWADAEAAATASHPDLEEEITAYRANFALSLRALVPGTIGLLHALHDRGIRLVALTTRLAKPDPRILGVLASRLGHPIKGVFYVDDNIGNVAAARTAGMDAVRFNDAEALMKELRERDLLD